MKRQYNLGWMNEIKSILPFAKFWDKFRQAESSPKAAPMQPIMSVTDEVISLKNTSEKARNIFLLPMLLGWLFGTFQAYDLLWPDLDDLEQSTNEFIELRKRKYGHAYFERVKDPVVLAIYNQVGEDGKTSWSEYLDFRYDNDDGYSTLVLHFSVILGFTLITLTLLWWFIRFPRQADIHFDRKRQIVYTWHRNRVCGCHFKHLGFTENTMGIALFFAGEKHKGKKTSYILSQKYIQAYDRGLGGLKEENTRLLSLVLAFMEQGKEVVITDDEFHRKPSSSYLFVDKQPENFEARLEKVLEQEQLLTDLYAENEKRLNPSAL